MLHVNAAGVSRRDMFLFTTVVALVLCFALCWTWRKSEPAFKQLKHAETEAALQRQETRSRLLLPKEVSQACSFFFALRHGCNVCRCYFATAHLLHMYGAPVIKMMYLSCLQDEDTIESTELATVPASAAHDEAKESAHGSASTSPSSLTVSSAASVSTSAATNSQLSSSNTVNAPRRLSLSLNPHAAPVSLNTDADEIDESPLSTHARFSVEGLSSPRNVPLPVDPDYVKPAGRKSTLAKGGRGAKTKGKTARVTFTESAAANQKKPTGTASSGKSPRTVRSAHSPGSKTKGTNEQSSSHFIEIEKEVGEELEVRA